MGGPSFIATCLLLKAFIISIGPLFWSLQCFNCIKSEGPRDEDESGHLDCNFLCWRWSNYAYILLEEWVNSCSHPPSKDITLHVAPYDLQDLFFQGHFSMEIQACKAMSVCCWDFDGSCCKVIGTLLLQFSVNNGGLEGIFRRCNCKAKTCLDSGIRFPESGISWPPPHSNDFVP